MLGMEAFERQVPFQEVLERRLRPSAACAAPPPSSARWARSSPARTEVLFGEGGMDHVGPVMAKLRETLTDIEQCKIEGPRAGSAEYSA